MKLSDLKEIAMTHREFDSLTSKAMDDLSAIPDFNSAVDAAKNSPYLPNQKRVDETIDAVIDDIGPGLSSNEHKTLFSRIKRLLGL